MVVTFDLTPVGHGPPGTNLAQVPGHVLSLQVFRERLLPEQFAVVARAPHRPLQGWRLAHRICDVSTVNRKWQLTQSSDRASRGHVAHNSREHRPESPGQLGPHTV